ncbi:MAG: hypothetical protein ACPGO3_14510 [Magnetospiraceae bacterium]
MRSITQKGSKNLFRHALIGGGIFLLAACAQQATKPPSGDLVAKGFYRGLLSSERADARRAVQHTLEKRLSGQNHAWKSGNGLAAGAVRVNRTFKTPAGIYCREYVERLDPPRDTVRDRVRTFCRTETGRWRPIGKVLASTG